MAADRILATLNEPFVGRRLLVDSAVLSDYWTITKPEVNFLIVILLDVTAAQKTLARARSTDVLARTQILSALADLAFRVADSVQPGARSNRP